MDAASARVVIVLFTCVSPSPVEEPYGASVCEDQQTIRAFDLAFDGPDVGERDGNGALNINLVGQPSVEHLRSEPFKPRSRKTWAALGYLVLSERPPSRSRLASLLFSEANDPLRALRWTLTELRRVLGPTAEVGGDPIQLNLPAEVTIDVELITSGTWKDAIGLPNLGEPLLAGLESIGAPEFESWLLAERRHIAAATEDALHEAALAQLARGDHDEAIRSAVSLVGLNPYRESHQATLIRAYVTAGDHLAAERQFSACTSLFVAELGSSPGPAVRAALAPAPVAIPPGGDLASFEALMEAGNAAVSAGAAAAGVGSLRSAVALADSLGEVERSIRARLALANSVFHSVTGDEEEGRVILFEAAELAAEAGETTLHVLARVELGYVDMLTARYHRAEQWLDPAEYDAASGLFDAAISQARVATNRPLEAYATSLLGRMHFLRGDFDLAAQSLETAIELHDWFAFVPWPQTFLGEVALERGDHEEAGRHLEQAFARAVQAGDTCWEGVSRRGLGLLAEARGDTALAFATLQDAADRCDRRSDTYLWARGYILDAQCTLGLAHSHETTETWVARLYELATRTGMREFLVKAMLHRTALGIVDERTAAKNLAADIDNPRLWDLVMAV
jgi:DNA-binding SARP family transcriptional activator